MLSGVFLVAGNKKPKAVDAAADAAGKAFGEGMKAAKGLFGGAKKKKK